jgi:NADPH-dependent ferric siderophore reductase
MVALNKRPPRRARDAAVSEAEWLSASMVRVVLYGDGLADFPGPAFSDAYVKLVFLSPALLAALPSGPLDLDALRSTLPPEEHPRQRTYTVRSWDGDRGELTLDFVVHGDAGVAGPWAARAKPGDRAFVLGPGGGYSPDPDASFHLFAGDASAAPAIAVALESLPGTAIGRALIEVHGPEDSFEIVHPGGVELDWLYVGERPVGSLLVPAVRESRFPPGAEAFVHGEAGFTRDLRRHLRIDRGLPPSSLSVSGYWRLGLDDEGWRTVKRDWVAAAEADDRTP